MSHRRILLVNEAGIYRDALARVLAREGHEVQAVSPAAVEKRARDFAPHVIVCSEAQAAALGLPGVGVLPLRRPVNVEELRRALRELQGSAG